MPWKKKTRCKLCGMKVVVLYLNKYPCEGTWYSEANGYFAELRPEHVRTGQELRYEQGEHVRYWRINNVLTGGKFLAVPVHLEAGWEDEPRTFQLVVND